MTVKETPLFYRVILIICVNGPMTVKETPLFYRVLYDMC